MSEPCNIPCDLCGNRPAYWFRNTSAAICDSPKCIQTNAANWAAHSEEMDREFAAREQDEPHPATQEETKP